MQRSGSQCTVITGATNQSYTPTKQNVQYSLQARVMAYNAAGASVAASVVTGSVATGTGSGGPPEPPNPGSSAITTIDYNVPVKGGEGLPQMTSAEVARWGQAAPETPTQATAIFPPDQPEGWPASAYTRATVYYFDEAGRRVNVLTPGGGISTSEYDNYADIVRQLTPGNRQRALEAGAGSASLAALLDSRSEYNEGDHQVVKRLGPQHEVVLPDGSSARARAYTSYTYVGGGLVSSAKEGAQLENGSLVDVRTSTDSYTGQSGLGTRLHKPTSVSFAPATKEEGATETRTTSYSKETGDVTETTAPGAGEEDPPIFSTLFGGAGSTAGHLKGAGDMTTDASGNLWVADSGNARLDEFTPTGTFVLAVGWGVSNGKAELQTCTSSCRGGTAGAAAGEMSNPTGVSYGATTKELYVTDTATNRVDVYTTSGAFVSGIGWGVKDGKPELEICTTSCQAATAGAGQGQLSKPDGITIDNAGVIWVADSGNSRLEGYTSEGAFHATIGTAGTKVGEFTGVADVVYCNSYLYATDSGGQRIERFDTTGAKKAQYGEPGKENGQFNQVGRIACNPATGELYAADTAQDRIDLFSKAGKWLRDIGTGGSIPGALSEPEGMTITSTGELFVVDAGNNRIESWEAPSSAARTKQTIYYTAAKNTKYPECGLHAEWVNLPCREQPKSQPTDRLGELAYSVKTYSMYDALATVERHNGSTTRASVTQYDAAGRAERTVVSSTTGASIPPVTYGYDSATGQQTTQSAESGTLVSTYNSLGELTAYKDSAGTTSKRKYDVDGRVIETFDGKAAVHIRYNAVTGLAKEAEDQTAGTFSATYTPEGQVEQLKYPNGMAASYAYDSVGNRLSVAYVSGATNLYKDAVQASIHGEWRAQQSTLGTESYKYDFLGRLTSVAETPGGGHGCTTTAYEYDESSDRTGETVYAPGSEGKCTAAGGTSTDHAYDSAGRLADPGTEYEPLGGATVIPGSDAGGEPLETGYYANGAFSSQTQNGKTISYSLDAADRASSKVEKSGATVDTTVSHYAGPEGSPAWTESTAGFTRDVTGMGMLLANETSTQTSLEIVNLHNDVVGTIADVSGASVSLTSEPTAFGVPTSSGQKLGWLGAELSFGSGVSGNVQGAYIPQVGLHLEPEELGNSALQDPVAEYQAGLYETAPVASITATLPGAVQPLPVNMREMEEFWADPSWNEEAEDVSGGEEEELIIINEGAATAAGAGIEVCESKVNYPHKSKHDGTTVNVVATLKCPDAETAYFIRVALFYEHRKVSQSSGGTYGGKEFSENTAAPCKTGWYQGWAEFLAQGIASNPARKVKWGFEMYVQC